MSAELPSYSACLAAAKVPLQAWWVAQILLDVCLPQLLSRHNLIALTRFLSREDAKRQHRSLQVKPSASGRALHDQPLLAKVYKHHCLFSARA